MKPTFDPIRLHKEPFLNENEHSLEKMQIYLRPTTTPVLLQSKMGTTMIY